MPFEKKKLKEVISLLPEYAWLLNNYDRKHNEKEWGESLVLYHKGDLELINLDLDSPLSDKSEFVSTILVEGNLKVKNIFNDETDGATGLIVLGDLHADNIVVGGQEIIITKDLYVTGLYWGDYNHGELIVKGKYQIKVFLVTDYGFDLDDSIFEKNIEIFMYDEYDVPSEGEEFIKNIFKPSFLMTDELDEDEIEEIYSWNEWLDRDAILEGLKNNEDLLLKNLKKQ